MDKDDLTIIPFMDELTFNIDPDLIDWSFIDDIDTGNPSSAKYRKLMKDIGLLNNYDGYGYYYI